MRGTVLMALLLGVGPMARPSLGRASVCAPAEVHPTFEESMAQAERAGAAGRHEIAARSYAAAYRALSEQERGGLLGEITVDNALRDYRAAQEQRPDEQTLFEEPLDLLEQLAAMRGPEGDEDGLPVLMVAERERLRARLDALRSLESSRPDGDVPEEPVPSGEGDDVEVVEPARNETRAQVPPRGQPVRLVEPSTSEQAAERGRSRRRVPREDAILLAAGVVSIAGAGGLIASGAWSFASIERLSEARLVALADRPLDEVTSAEYRAQLAEWRGDGRARATAQVSVGVALAAVGLGLTIWGGISRARASVEPGGAARHRRTSGQRRLGVVWRRVAWP